MTTVEIAVIGTGGIAAQHLEHITANPRFKLTAVCDVDRKRAEEVGSKYGVPAFYDYEELLAKRTPAAVVVATPHFFHPPIAIAALNRGLHVLVEKPIAVQVKDASKMISAYEAARRSNGRLVFATMFMLRSVGYWKRVKEILDAGELGRIVRASWIVTDWFRSQRYFDTGGWRATWHGEGGGALLNQCPHNLDLYQWYFGMPQRVTAIAALGKYHKIEVEDEVTAIFQHANGMIGHFIASTAESPGTNRLEIVGENGRLLVEKDTVTLDRNSQSMLESIRSSTERFPAIPHTEEILQTVNDERTAHRRTLDNFADAILDGAAPIAPAVEGYASLSLANAVMLSALEKESIGFPLDEERYARLLDGLIAGSKT
ncbi:MAG TPA: Gfo/Idh/MocA family oxidoreductase [Spirochaetia bacterium]|nr:Gfo/Idh/MocA family oxidoreductase [Spirochaetia bacterium]